MVVHKVCFSLAWLASNADKQTYKHVFSDLCSLQIGFKRSVGREKGEKQRGFEVILGV